METIFSSHPEFLVASTCLGWDVRGFAGEQRCADVSGTSVVLHPAGTGRGGRPGAAGEPGLVSEQPLLPAPGWKDACPRQGTAEQFAVFA